ncbi:coiled-coil domain-containing protein 43-like [Crassostrea virginica]|uniref:Coiled-coil domain-containing protein 43 n=1 Tax=Crassostrea virginica TaxID=6565 RepID=A0A8B8CQE7_CRAVI|nr:coiled-coil domain-containing protein 43-like [Crassostrea virginica]
MAAASVGFEDWLGEKLTSLNPEVDTEVFVTYITGILETETDEEDTRESIMDILGEVLESEKEAVCDEVIQRWNQEQSKSAKPESDTSALATQLSEILENQKIESVKPKEKSADEIARKEAILAQYGAVSEGESDDEDVDPGGDNAEMLVKNDNAEAVNRAVQEQREKSKQEYEKKKEKDKQDRELQKQKEKDRKETEKKRTQKGERRR